MNQTLVLLATTLAGLTLAGAAQAAGPISMGSVATETELCERSRYVMNTSRSLAAGHETTFVVSTGSTLNNVDDIELSLTGTARGSVTFLVHEAIRETKGWSCGKQLLNGMSVIQGFKGTRTLDIPFDMDDRGYGPYAWAQLGGDHEDVPASLCLTVSAASQLTYKFTVKVDRAHRTELQMPGGEYVEVYTTHPELFGSKLWAKPDYERLVFIQHGAGMNAAWYFKRALNGLWRHLDDDLGQSPVDVGTQAVIVAPEFSNDSNDRCLDPGQLEWGSYVDGRGSYGHTSDPAYSSYAFADELVERVDANTIDLERVFMAGQSGGGQMIHRYAMATELPDLKPDLEFTFVPVNPGSWAYLWPQRLREIDQAWVTPSSSNLLSFYETQDASGAVLRTNANCDIGEERVGTADGTGWDYEASCGPATDYLADRIDFSGNGLVNSTDPTYEASCASLANDWPLGLNGMVAAPPYVADAWASAGTWGAWVDRFLGRDVLPSIGLNDDAVYAANGQLWAAPQTCRYRVQGHDRIQRANAWHEHMCDIGAMRGVPAAFDLFEVPDTGHTSDVWRKYSMRNYLFGDTYPAANVIVPCP